MKENSRHLPMSIAVLIWLNALPYLSRLPRGSDWVAQYLPDEGLLVPGLIFFHAMYSMSAIPLIWVLRHREKPGLIWTLALLVVTMLTWYLNKDYDLAVDPQAAIGLVTIPLISMVAAYGVMAVDRELRQLLHESIHGMFVKQNTRKNFGLLEYIPGFSELPETVRILIGVVLVSLTFSLFIFLIEP
jgi:hypothetical protein